MTGLFRAVHFGRASTTQDRLLPSVRAEKQTSSSDGTLDRGTDLFEVSGADLVPPHLIQELSSLGLERSLLCDGRGGM